MKSHGVAHAIVYAHLSNHSYAQIQATLKKMGTTISRPGIGKIIERHVGSQGRVRNLEQAGERKKTTKKKKLPNNVRGKIVKFTKKKRGQVKVTSKYIQKKIPEARGVSDRTIRRVLNSNNLFQRRRRRKQCNTKINKTKRIRVAKKFKKMGPKGLAKMGYTDGASIYIAKSQSQQRNKHMAALGPFVYRQEHEGLLEGCVGPSDYAKGQGEPVKFWGLLYKGQLKIHVMPRGQHTNGKYYAKIISEKMQKWIHGTSAKKNSNNKRPTRPKSRSRSRRKQSQKNKRQVTIVQDNERALWTKIAQESMKNAKIRTFKRLPPGSPDLNPIETCWAHLRDFINLQTMPEKESRRDFVKRLHNGVRHLNNSKGDLLNKLCTTLKTRAEEVILRKGARTSY